VRAVALGVAIACVAFAANARAANPPQSGTLPTLAQEVTLALGPVPETSLVVAGSLTSDQPAPRGDELAVRIATLIAGRVGKTARAHAQVAPLGTARALAGRAGGLIFITTEIAKGELRVTADLYPVQSNAWDRVRNPLPSPKAHAFAHARIDAEIRSFLAPVLLEQTAVHKAKHDEGEVIAAACGDADEDGGMELVLVSRSRVSVGKVRASKYVPARAVSWASLSPRAPAPLRDVLGTAVVSHDQAGARIFVGSTDRGGVSLAADLSGPKLLPGLPLEAPGGGFGCAQTNAATSSLEGPVIDCFVNLAANVRVQSPAARFDAFAAAEIVARDGARRSFVAAREPGGKLRVRFGEEPARTVDGAGAQVAIADLDQDGVPELVSTLDSGEDALVITSWASGSDGKPRLRLAAPGGVRALAVCPPEEKGVSALIAVVGGEIWIVR
jgi:hypothetical protein